MTSEMGTQHTNSLRATQVAPTRVPPRIKYLDTYLTEENVNVSYIICFYLDKRHSEINPIALKILKNVLVYLLKARTMEPSKTHCYITTGKHSIVSLSKESLLCASRDTEAVVRQPPINFNSGKVFLRVRRDTAIEELVVTHKITRILDFGISPDF
jgi:hypothetical protein